MRGFEGAVDLALQLEALFTFERSTASSPLDGDEHAVLQLPREMTAQRWPTILDSLELRKKQSQKA